MTDESIEAIQIALGSLAAGDSPGALKSKFDDLYRADNVQLSVALLELAADALDKAGFERGKFSAIESFRHIQAIPTFTPITAEVSMMNSIREFLR